MSMRKKWMIISGITLFILVLIFPIVFMYYASWVMWNGTSVIYRRGWGCSSNGEYIGVIDTYSNRVSISDQSQKEVSELDMDIEDTWPYQIVLGEKTYFILYHLDDERKGAAKIVQYDYQSVKKVCS